MESVSFGNLPDHILGKILSHCDPSDGPRFGTVCPKWQRVMEKSHGVFMVAGTINDVKVEQISNGDSRLQIAKRYDESISGLNVLHSNPPIFEDSKLKPVNDSGSGDCKKLPHVTFEELQSKLNIDPELVRKISFVGALPIQVPLAFMAMCNNISALHFHLSSLVGIKASWPLSIDIPTLKTFVIDSMGIWDAKQKKEKDKSLNSSVQNLSIDGGWWEEMQEIFKIIVALLNQNTFSHLQTLILDIPFSEQKEGILVNAIAKFLAKHAETLCSFCFHQAFPVTFEEPNKDSPITTEDQEDGTSAAESNNDDNDSEIEMNLDLTSLAQLASLSTLMKDKKVSLKNLHIGLLKGQESDPLWKNLILFQRNLSSLVFTGDQMPFPGITLKANSSTLTNITLDVRDFVDLQALEECKCLISLSLQSERDKEADEGVENTKHKTDNLLSQRLATFIMNQSNVKNMDKLPESLEILRIHGMNVDSEILESLICSNLKWSQLKGLELIDCGNEGQFGITLKSIAYILEKKTLQWFRFDHSLNRKSLVCKKLSPFAKSLVLCLHFNSVTSFKIRGIINGLGDYATEQLTGNKEEVGVRFMEPDVFEFPEVINPTGAYRRPMESESTSPDDASTEDGDTDDEEIISGIMYTSNDEDTTETDESADDSVD